MNHDIFNNMPPNFPKVGFDLDGTLTENWFLHNPDENLYLLKQSKFNQYCKKIIGKKLLKTKQILQPLLPCAIITSRPIWLAQYGKQWLEFFDVDTVVCVYAMNIYHDDRQRSIYKANIINKLGLDYYFEDEEILRKQCNELCINTKILMPIEAIELNFASKKTTQLNLTFRDRNENKWIH